MDKKFKIKSVRKFREAEKKIDYEIDKINKKYKKELGADFLKFIKYKDKYELKIKQSISHNKLNFIIDDLYKRLNITLITRSPIYTNFNKLKNKISRERDIYSLYFDRISKFLKRK